MSKSASALWMPWPRTASERRRSVSARASCNVPNSIANRVSVCARADRGFSGAPETPRPVIDGSIVSKDPAGSARTFFPRDHAGEQLGAARWDEVEVGEVLQADAVGAEDAMV